VAKELNTTREYVYKERGKFKKKGLLVTGQSLTITKEGNELTVFKGQPIDNYSNTSPPFQGDRTYGIGDYDIPLVQRDDLKSMYSCFEKNMNASDVVALHGIRPDISEREYNRYLSTKSRDPMEFQNDLISDLQNTPSEIQVLTDKAGRGILLTNSELLSIINFKMRVYASQHLQRLFQIQGSPHQG
jgi:hypothetical protein